MKSLYELQLSFYFTFETFKFSFQDKPCMLFRGFSSLNFPKCIKICPFLVIPHPCPAFLENALPIFLKNFKQSYSSGCATYTTFTDYYNFHCWTSNLDFNTKTNCTTTRFFSSCKMWHLIQFRSEPWSGE